MKGDIVYIHLPSKGTAPKLEAASRPLCRWGSWMGWIDDSQLEARTPSSLSQVLWLRVRMEGGEAGADTPAPCRAPPLWSLGKGQLLCPPPLPCLLSCERHHVFWSLFLNTWLVSSTFWNNHILVACCSSDFSSFLFPCIVSVAILDLSLCSSAPFHLNLLIPFSILPPSVYFLSSVLFKNP